MSQRSIAGEPKEEAICSSRFATLGSLAVATLLTVGVLCAGAVSWLPAKDLFPNHDRARFTLVRALLPEGWSFFTKSPRGDLIRPYVSVSRQWKSASRGPNNQPAYAFGLNRESRLTEFDLEGVVPTIQSDWWEACPASLTDRVCIDDAVAHRVDAVGGAGRLCQTVGISKRPPVPWAYRDSVVRMPGAVVKLQVRCSR